jgi:hypothetical protein
VVNCYEDERVVLEVFDLLDAVRFLEGGRNVGATSRSDVEQSDVDFVSVIGPDVLSGRILGGCRFR